MKSIITFSLTLLAAVATQASTGSDLSEMGTPGSGSGFSIHSKYVNEETAEHPSTLIGLGYLKSAEEVLADNNKIVDDQQTQEPLYLEASVNEINENNRIVDNTAVAYAPLDFQYINKVRQTSLFSELPKL